MLVQLNHSYNEYADHDNAAFNSVTLEVVVFLVSHASELMVVDCI